jgi:hypothetical protein
MPVVSKGFGEAQSAHHGEGNMIDDAGLGCLAALKGFPRLLDLLECRFNQKPFLDERLS